MGANNSIEKLEAYRRELAAATKPDLPTVLVCFGTGCQANGSRLVAEAFMEAIKEQGLQVDVTSGSRPRGVTGTARTGLWWR